MNAGSVFLTRVSMVHYTETRQDLLAHANAVLDELMARSTTPRLERTYAPADAAQAHRDLVSRQYAGELLLVP
jgi:NADPH2:quinone reductase